jgi:hypothetical protein
MSTSSRDLEEYRALRATIRQRGTARTWVFVATLCAWASLTVALATLGSLPLLSLVPLLVLAAGFEAVFALHVAVERVGRYLQVFHADRWEQTAMAFGAPLAGTGVDPLFAVCFGLAAACNLVSVVVARPVRAEWTALGSVHLLVLARIVLARRAAGRQRPADLARFMQLRDGASSTRP